MVELDENEINKPEVAAALRELEGADGTLTPEQVLAAAKSAHSPLHRCGFEWDKNAAAEKFNLAVARSLIRTVRYRVVTHDHGMIKVPIYVRDPNAPQKTQGYVALRVVAKKGPDAFEIVRNELDLALSHLRRAQSIGIALGFADRLAELIDSVSAFDNHVEAEIVKRTAASGGEAHPA